MAKSNIGRIPANGRLQLPRMTGVATGTVLILLSLGAGIGVLVFGGGAVAMKVTSTEAFCVSCHEQLAKEHKDTIHDKNRTGVRAACPDCHVPHEPGPLLAAKLDAVGHLWGHYVTHSIDTPEKFEAKRHELAERVWAKMKETDSRECRHCHSVGGMDLAKQDRSARKKHSNARMQERDETCIDCHKGIAHTLPKRDDERSG